MVLATLFGGPLGASAGIIAGSFVFGKVFGKLPARDFIKSCDQTADADSNVPLPENTGKPVTFLQKLLLKDTSPALTNPDYERALFINKILELLWPHLSPAIHKEVMKQAKAPIEEALAKVPLIEDLRIDRLDLGERPFRVDSFKTYNVVGDEIIMEVPLFWGGDIHVRATAVVKASSYLVDLPVDVANVQFKALARVTLHLVEALPCIGGVSISLLEEPWVDVDLNLLGSPDIMALPGVPLAVKTAIKIVAGKMLVFPNMFSVPLMPNFGMLPPPQGMLKVRVVSGANLKSSLLDTVDPYVELEVRKGRAVQTSVIQNDQNPVWNEELEMVVDDPVTQFLNIAVMDEDMLQAEVVGGTKLVLEGADFMVNPRVPVMIQVPLYEPGDEGAFPVAHFEDITEAMAMASSGDVSSGASAAIAAAAAAAAAPKKRGLMGKLRRKKAVAVPPPPAVSVSPAASASLIAGSSPASTPRSPSSLHAGGGEPSSPLGTEDSTELDRKHPPPGTVTGLLTLEITFMPFHNAPPPPPPDAELPVEAAKAAAEGGEDASAKSGPPLASTPSMPRMPSRSLNAASLMGPTPNQKGVLTVSLKKVMHLSNPADSYVVLRLYDPTRLPIPDIETKTKVELNEASPRFNFVTDFVNISAGSVLTLTVFSQPGAMAALTSLRVPILQKAKADQLGKVRVPLDEVVKAGRVKNVYPLQEAQTGEMHLTLEWSALALEDDVVVEE